MLQSCTVYFFCVFYACVCVCFFSFLFFLHCANPCCLFHLNQTFCSTLFICAKLVDFIWFVNFVQSIFIITLLLPIIRCIFVVQIKINTENVIADVNVTSEDTLWMMGTMWWWWSDRTSSNVAKFLSRYIFPIATIYVRNSYHSVWSLKVNAAQATSSFPFSTFNARERMIR